MVARPLRPHCAGSTAWCWAQCCTPAPLHPSTHPACDCLADVGVYVSSPGIQSSNSAGQTGNFWLLILSRLNLYDFAALLSGVEELVLLLCLGHA